MKHILIAFLITFNTITAFAQKHHAFADFGLPFPGFSITYDYQFAKHWSAGLGIQGYRLYRNQTTERDFTPSVFADVRLHIRPGKNNQFFSFFDAGISFYKVEEKYFRDSITVYNIQHNNGFYTGLGFGYFRRISERGRGPYVAIKLALNWYNYDEYSIISQELNRQLVGISGTPVLSLGFKF